MARAVSPSENGITKGQAGKFADLIVAGFVKSGLPSAETQQVLERQGAALIAQFIALVQEKVDQASKIIRRTVPVDRSCSSQDAIADTGRRQNVAQNVLATMPQGEGETVTIEFIPLNKWMSDDEVDTRLAESGLVPADPFALLAFNAAEPDFASSRPCFTHWQDANGAWCYAAFYVWFDERGVGVSRGDYGWGDDWWVAGVRKSA
jgi:hypothetical protein